MVAISITVKSETSGLRVTKKIHQRIIKSFMDIIIMSQLKKGPASGYDLISYIYSKFHFMASSGTVYSLLYSLERNGLIEGYWVERKRVYKLTIKGTETLTAIVDSYDKLKDVVVNILKT